MSVSSAKKFVEIISTDEEGDEIQFVPYVKPPPPVIDLLISSSDNEHNDPSSSPRKKKKAKRKSIPKDESAGASADFCDPNVARTVAKPTPTPTANLTSPGSNVDYEAREQAIKAAFAGVGRSKRRQLEFVDDDELFDFPDQEKSSDNAINQGSEVATCSKTPEQLPSIRIASSIFEFESVPEPAAEVASTTVVESAPIQPPPTKAVAAKRGRKSKGSLGQPVAAAAEATPVRRTRVSRKQCARLRTNEEIFHFLTTIGVYKEGEAPPELPPATRTRGKRVVMPLVCPLPLVPDELALSEDLDDVPVLTPIRRNVTSTPKRTPTPSPTKTPQTEVSNQNLIIEEPIIILDSNSQAPELAPINTESLLGISRALGPAEPLPLPLALAPRKVTMTPNENMTVKLKVTKQTPPPPITTGVWITPTPRKRSATKSTAAKGSPPKKKKSSEPAPATATATLNRAVTQQQLAAAENSMEVDDIVELPTPLVNLSLNSEPLQPKPYLPIGWSQEMANFYDSVPNTNFYLKKVLSNMSGDKSLWKHDEARCAKSRPRVNRNLRCVNCKQTGHLARSCNEKKRLIVCHRCGQIGHDENSTNTFYKRCHNAVCLICGRRYNETKYGCNGVGCKFNKRPLKCGTCDGHHSSAHCPDNWRRFCNTTSLTEVGDGSSKAFGDKPEYRLHRDSFCANCGGKGHSFYHCRMFSATESHYNKFPKQNPRVFKELPPAPEPPKIAVELPKEPEPIEPELVTVIEPEAEAEPAAAQNEPNSNASSPMRDSQVTTVPETPSPKKSLEDEAPEMEEAPFRFNFQTELIDSLQQFQSPKKSIPWTLPPLDEVPAFASTSKGIVHNPYYTKSSFNAKTKVPASATITSGELERELEYERRPLVVEADIDAENSQMEDLEETIRIPNENLSINEPKIVEKPAPPKTMNKCQDYPDCSNSPKPFSHCYNMSIVPEHHKLLLDAWLADSSILDAIISEHSVQVSILRRQRSIHILGPISALLPAQISILSAISKIQTESEPSVTKPPSILNLNPPMAPEPDLIILDDDEVMPSQDKKSVLTVALLESEWALISAQSFQQNGLLSQLSTAFGVNIHVCKDSLTASIEDGDEANRKLAQKNIVFWLECHAAKVDYVMQYSMDAPALSALPTPAVTPSVGDWSKKKKRPAPSSRPQSRKFNKRQRGEEEPPRSPAKRRRNRQQQRWSDRDRQIPEGLYTDFGSHVPPPGPGFVIYDEREWLADPAHHGWNMTGPNTQGWYDTRPRSRRRRKGPSAANSANNNNNNRNNSATANNSNTSRYFNSGDQQTQTIT